MLLQYEISYESEGLRFATVYVLSANTCRSLGKQKASVHKDSLLGIESSRIVLCRIGGGFLIVLRRRRC